MSSRSGEQNPEKIRNNIQERNEYISAQKNQLENALEPSPDYRHPVTRYISNTVETIVNRLYTTLESLAGRPDTETDRHIPDGMNDIFDKAKPIDDISRLEEDLKNTEFALSPAARQLHHFGEVERLITPEKELKQAEEANYKDIFKLLDAELELENDEAIYLGAGEDYVPADNVEASWTYLGADYEEGGEREDIEFMNKDLAESPELEERDLVLLKKLGDEWENERVREGAIETAINTVSEGRYLATNYDLSLYKRLDEGTELENLEIVSSTLENGVYNIERLNIYQVEGSE
jgi:hypothetical protein